MAERPDEYELDDYPEKKYGKDTDRPARGSSEEKFFQENSLRGENYKKFRIRQQMIESNKVNVHKSFLKGSQTEVKILKRTILSDILNIPYDEVDETKFDLMVEPIDDIETFKLYYDKNIPLLKYNSKDDRITILSRDNLERFKVKYVNETTKRYAEKEMKTDFSIKSDLSAIDLEVRQSESERYHRDLNRLQARVNELENEKKTLVVQANQRVRDLENQLQRARQQAASAANYDYRNEIIRNLEQDLAYARDQIFEISSDRDRKIGGLMDQINRMKENESNEIEALNESLQIKSTQIIESQREIKNLEKNISDLEDDIKLKNVDNSKLQRQLDTARKDLNKEKVYYKRKLNELEEDKKLLENKLKTEITNSQKSIELLTKQRDRAQKNEESSSSFQSSLENKIAELERSILTYELNLKVEKEISEDIQKQLDSSREKIKNLENDILETEKLYKSRIETYQSEIDMREKWSKKDELIIEQKKQAIENLENKVRENEAEIGSLRFERETLQDKVAELNREIEHSDNTSDVLAEQLDRVNNEIIVLNERIQEHQVENQTLTIELDSLRSNFGNLVAASEATNHNNTLEIGRLKIKIKELEDNDDIDEQVNELLKSVDNYKGFLNDAYEDKKKLKKEFEEEFDKLNKEKESLVQDLKNKTKN